MKRAFVTGITGQDGHYLTELLLQKGYEVHGYARRGSTPPDERVVLHTGDLTDPAALRRALTEVRPDEVYNLGAQSHVGASFDEPEYTWRVTALPILTILEWARLGLARVRIYQASSSEMWGLEPPPQNEDTRFSPQSPYAIAKVAAHQTVSLYRRAYGVFAVGGILLNHESPRRPASFVTRKITRAVARIATGLETELVLGNLDARRDWGHARDYVEAMWLMLQQDVSRDFVVATSESHSVREFCEAAFGCLDLDWQKYVKSSSQHMRPAEVPNLRGDATRIREALGWVPKTAFRELVEEMVRADLKAIG